MLIYSGLGAVSSAQCAGRCAWCVMTGWGGAAAIAKGWSTRVLGARTLAAAAISDVCPLHHGKAMTVSGPRRQSIRAAWLVDWQGVFDRCLLPAACRLHQPMPVARCGRQSACPRLECSNLFKQQHHRAVGRCAWVALTGWIGGVAIEKGCSTRVEGSQRGASTGVADRRGSVSSTVATFRSSISSAAGHVSAHSLGGDCPSGLQAVSDDSPSPGRPRRPSPPLCARTPR